MGWLALLLGCLLPNVVALFEEQAGEFDWVKENIGEAKFLAFPTSKKKKSTLCYVATESNVVAALRLRTGAIAWRQVLPETEALDLMKVYKRSILVISNGGETIRTFITTDGALSWDTNSFHLPENVAHLSTSLRFQTARAHNSSAPVDAVFLADVTGDSLEDVVVLTAAGVVGYNGATGEELWAWTRPELACTKLAGDDTDVEVSIVCQDAEANLVIVTLDLLTGDEITSRSTSVSLPASTQYALTDNYKRLVVLSGASITSIAVRDPTDVVTQKLTTLLRNAALLDEGMSVEAPEGQACVVIRSETKAWAVAFDHGSSSLVFVQAFETMQAFGGVTGTSGSMPALGIASVENNRVSVKSISTTAPRGFSDIAMHVDAFAGHGRAKRVWLRPPRALVLTEDRALTMFEGDRLRWTREEALAEISEVHFVELPEKKPFTSKEGYPPLSQRLAPHFQEIMRVALSITAPIVRLPAMLEGLALGEAAARSPRSTEFDGSLFSDNFGFKQMVVVSTKSGKVFGIDSESSAVVWSVHLATQPGQHLWKTFVLGARMAGVIMRGTDGHASVSVLDTLSGEVQSTQAAPGVALDALVLPFGADGLDQTILLVAEDLTVTVVPSNAATERLVTEHSPNIHFYVTNLDKNTVSGYALQADARFSRSGFSGDLRWSMALPAHERISALSERNPSEIIQSGLRMTGGPKKPGTLYRYLNPNTLVLSTVRSLPVGQRIVPSITRSTDPAVNVYLIDVVTGHILEKIVQRYAAGPVHTVQSENTVIWHFWNIKNNQHEVCVAEFYQDRGDNDALPPALIAKFGATFFSSFFSSHNAPEPVSLQQCYVLQSALRSLDVTVTRHGLGGKQFLFGLASGQLLALPKQLLDPRRPTTPSDEDKAEGLVPYGPELPSSPLNMLTSNHTIPNLRSSKTGPTRLESTTMVAVWGLDLFFTRATPSGTFDLLSEDFNYLFLVTTVTGVGVAILVAQRLATKKKLNEEWK